MEWYGAKPNCEAVSMEWSFSALEFVWAVKLRACTGENVPFSVSDMYNGV